MAHHHMKPKRQLQQGDKKTTNNLQPSEITTDNILVKEYGPNRNTDTKQKDFLDQYVNNRGLIYKSCKQTAIRYSTFRAWLRDSDSFKLKFDEAQQRVNEQVEESLMRKFNSTSPMAEMFYLKARDRRYALSMSVEGQPDKPIKIVHDRSFLQEISRKIVEKLKSE